MKYDLSIPKAITIHQPHFFPWLPYVARVASSTHYVMLDDAQYRKYFYQDRTVLLNSHEQTMQIKIPVSGSTSKEIREVAIVKDGHPLEKIKKTIFLNYKREKYFDSVWPPLEKALDAMKCLNKLVELNLYFIRWVLQLMNIKVPEIHFASSLNLLQEKNHKIIDICGRFDSEFLLCGWGMSSRIHDMDLMGGNDIHFVTLEKETVDEFLPGHELHEGLSIVDTLMTCGIEHTRDIIMNLREVYLNKCCHEA